MSAALPDAGGYSSLAAALAAPAYRRELNGSLAGFLRERRWFAGHDLEAIEASVEDTVVLAPTGDLVLAILRVVSGAVAVRYQVPLFAAPSGGVVDALDTPAGAEVFLDALLHGPADARLAITMTDATALREHGRARVLHGEQSNTSVVFGGTCILKLFRRLSEGRNPDVELTAWLSGPGNFASVPRVLAWGGLDAGAWAADSLVIQEFVANDGDGWTWALERAKVAATAVAGGRSIGSWFEAAEGRDLLAGAAALGDVTATLHRALESAMDEGLRPEPFSREDWDEVVGDVHADIDAASAVARDIAPGAAGVLDALHARVPDAPRSFGRKTRVHGDYHLGQVLHTTRGWFVVDFEGEPARSLASRTVLQHPLADVAGMLRSWDYAGATAAGESHRAWVDAAAGAFLDAYRGRAAGSDYLPATRADEDAILDLFVLRKALYELRYELSSRPAWAAIPMAALERIARGQR